MAVGCLSKARCEVTDCGKKHHALLHSPFNTNQNSYREEKQRDSPKHETEKRENQGTPSSSNQGQGNDRLGARKKKTILTFDRL